MSGDIYTSSGDGGDEYSPQDPPSQGLDLLNDLDLQWFQEQGIDLNDPSLFEFATRDTQLLKDDDDLPSTAILRPPNEAAVNAVDQSIDPALLMTSFGTGDMPMPSIEPVTESMQQRQHTTGFGFETSGENFDTVASSWPAAVDQNASFPPQEERGRSTVSNGLSGPYSQNGPLNIDVWPRSAEQQTRSGGGNLHHRERSEEGPHQQQHPDPANVNGGVYDNHVPQAEQRGAGMSNDRFRMLNSAVHFAGGHGAIHRGFGHLPLPPQQQHGRPYYHQPSLHPYSHSPTQMPERNLHLAYGNPNHQLCIPNDFAMSPSAQSVMSASPLVTRHHRNVAYSPVRSSATPGVNFGARSKSKRLAGTASPIIRKESSQCIDCGKNFKKSIQDLRCNRCATKHERHNATPTSFTVDPAVPNLEAARQYVYPPILGKGPPVEDLERVRADENLYIERFLGAVNVVIPGGEGGDHEDPSLSWPQRQQVVYNQKCHLEPTYASPYITARFRALFHELLSFHTGTDHPVYASGGDNAGYGDNCRLKFGERVDEACEFLRGNKRIVMDVVEGRGVQAFVANPRGFDKRKSSNNECNVVKKVIMDKGKRFGGGGGHEGGGVAERGNGTRKRKRVVEQRAEGEEVVAGPSRGRGRRAVEEHVIVIDGGRTDGEYVPPNGGGHGPGRARTYAWLNSGQGRGKRRRRLSEED